MRKFLTSVIALFMTGSLFAGGLVTNTNQSAAWVRLPARNASVDIDAAYYNPAGLMKLNNGYHFSISNQTISQARKIENFYKYASLYGLNQNLYRGSISAPVFPSIYAVYKTDKLAFSFGFDPIGGGGGGTFKRGLPSFEMSASDLVPALAASEGATGYSLDTYFKSSSVFFGFQGCVSYKFSDMVSVAVGLRFVTAKNTYQGYLNNIEVNLPSGWTRADSIMSGIARPAATASLSTTALVTGGAGPLTLAQAQGMGIITALQEAQLAGALAAYGSPTTVTIAQADAFFKGVAAQYNATAFLLHNQSLDAQQTGSGFSPIFSVNISPSENLNIAIRYEMITRIVLKNKTSQDLLIGYTPTGGKITEFPDGGLTNSDLPAMLALGAEYKVSPKLKIALGADYFFDKNADYGHALDLDHNPSTPDTPVPNSYIIKNNGLDINAGVEYHVTDKLLLSCGYMYSNKGVNDNYQSDITYGQATHTFGLGGAYSVTKSCQINLGFSYTDYVSTSSYIDHIFAATGTLERPLQTYFKNAFIVGVGVDFSF
jgi:long-chain fatty acid transport protein